MEPRPERTTSGDDVTARLNRAEKALRARELDFQMIVDSIPLPVAVMTPVGEVEALKQPGGLGRNSIWMCRAGRFTVTTGRARKDRRGVIENWWRQGMMGGAKAHYDGIVAFSQADFRGPEEVLGSDPW